PESESRLSQNRICDGARGPSPKAIRAGQLSVNHRQDELGSRSCAVRHRKVPTPSAVDRETDIAGLRRAQGHSADAEQKNEKVECCFHSAFPFHLLATVLDAGTENLRAIFSSFLLFRPL